MSPWLIPVLIAVLAAASASAQGLPPPVSQEMPGAAGSPQSGPAAFDVVSIHEHSNDDQNMSWRTTPNGLITRNIALQNLVASAFHVKMDLVLGGPPWVDSKGFDIEAKVLPGDEAKPLKLTEAQRRVLLRAMLIDRFHLQAHPETKILPVYELVLAKGGSKMRPAPPAPLPAEAKTDDTRERGSMSFRPGHLEAHAYKVSNLAEQLGYMVQRTVLDKTGLTGDYDLTLDWTPEEQLQAAGENGADVRPSIYTALQEQLGLKLVPTKGPVETLVIDHVELPTPN